MIGLLRTWLAVLILAQVALPVWAAGTAPSTIKWRTELKHAGAESTQSGKPILVQMTAPWCGFCHKMLRETFSDPTVSKRINEGFVPLLVDADQHPEVVEVLGVSSFPATIVISSDFKVIGRIDGFHRPTEYLKKLAPFSGAPLPSKSLAVRSLSPAPLDQSQASASPKTRITAAPLALKQAEPARLPQPTNLSASPASATGIAKQPVGNLATHADQSTTVSAIPTTVGFGGVCLVSMLRERSTNEGKPEFSCVHRGVRLQFASARHLAEFKQSPETFWPQLDGLCPVALAHDEDEAAGNPESAGVYQSRLVFFRNEAHRQAFTKEPRQVMQAAQQVHQSAANKP